MSFANEGSTCDAMIGVLLWKDLCRARRNPLPYVIHICVPLVITGLLGLVFAGTSRSQGSGLGKIQLAVVDEDDTPVTRLLRGALNQAEASKHLEAVFLDRAAAMDRVTNDRVAAVLVIPRGLTSELLGGTNTIQLELVKNPARQFHPAIVEELMAVVTTSLNALRRNLAPDLAAWRGVLSGTGNLGYRQVAELIVATGERVERFWRRLDPIPVVYEKDSVEEVATPDGTRPAGPAVKQAGLNLFALVLPGMAAMFLFFVAEAAMRDLHSEIRHGTFRRYCTFPSRIFAFVWGKVLFAYAIVAIAVLILLVLGPWLFGFWWRKPVVVLTCALALGLFASGLASSVSAWLGSDRRAEVLTNLVGMFLGFGSGCAFPAESLPPLLRDYVTPWLPPHWFIQVVRQAQGGEIDAGFWMGSLAWTAALGLALTVLAAATMQRGLARSQ